ncbi:hypothetical protein ACJRO7_014324 [Eucalyptus globulus]|uniref:Uncharacterized protein n=1 Tax=Eucalyptus globulus TaxID=34317 RepID=A0ABD3L3R2_EUCGL
MPESLSSRTKNQPRDLVTHLRFKVDVRGIEQDHPNRASVVRIDHAHADVDLMLPRQTRYQVLKQQVYKRFDSALVNHPKQGIETMFRDEKLHISYWSTCSFGYCDAHIGRDERFSYCQYFSSQPRWF